MSEYKISLGVDVDVSDIQSQINTKAKDVSIPIKLEVENIGDIKKQIQGLGVLKGGIEIPLSIDSSATIKSAQQIGQKIGTTITKDIKQSINIDDVVNKQVSSIMKKYAIAGDEGSDAFKKIKQALVECRNELNRINNGSFSIDEEVFGRSSAIDGVTKAIAEQMRAVNNLGDEYVKLADYITDFNKKNSKIRIPTFIKQEQGDDYKSNKGGLGVAFTTGNGQDFADFITELNGNLGETIDLTKGEAAAFDELVRKVNLGRQQRDAAKKSENYFGKILSVEEILEQNGVNRNEIYDDVMASSDAISAAEKEIAQASTASANVVAQNEERKQQAYQETANVVQRQSRLISDSAQDAINNVSSERMGKYFRIDPDDSSAFDEEMKNLVNQWTSGKGKLVGVQIEARTSWDKEAEARVKRLHQAQVEYNNALGVTEKKTIAWTQIGTKTNKKGKESPLYGFAEVVDKYSNSLGKTKSQTDAFVKQQKNAVSDLTNQINQLNRAAIDQNASRPIKDDGHLTSLKNKYDDIASAIQRMGSASNDNDFQEERNNVRTLISEYKSLRDEYRNAENVSNKMKGTDLQSGVNIALNDLKKFKADAKDYPQLITTANKLQDALNQVGDASSLNKFTDQLKVARSELAKVKAETIAANRKEKVGIDVSGATSRIANIQRISPEINEFKAEINGAEVTVESLLNDLSKVNTAGDFSVVNKKINSFEKAAESAGIAVKELSQSASNASFTKEINQEINEFIKLQKQIENTRFEIGKLEITGDSTNQIAELKRQLEELENTYDNLMQAFLKKVSVNADIIPEDALSKLDNGITEATTNANNRLEQFKAKWADTRAELAKSIKADIDLGNFENEIDTMRSKFNSLSDANDELRRSYNATEDAYKAMTNAAKANSGDEVADREKLIQAEKEYAAALEKTNNLIKQQARADKIDADALRLQDDREIYQAKIDNWLTKNSAATERFGAKLKELRAAAETADRVELNHLEKELTKVDKAADKAGLKMMSLGDRIKSKAKEYMAYLSVAEVFMWIEQAARAMFDTVLEIDTAMTGLHRVTDLTASQYDALFNNMISSAKEYGATLNDIINATTDWVRAGFDADTALGLAEVTTMYQHISDLDYDTAAENLITAYNGFKDELNTAFSGDQVAAVEYIADIFNELDRQNCP